ncbi:putative toxin-antitoxin system toxin component, PIN family [candidate division CSSED10-310 bacterium]|uniref:Toxin-antitoxin system toxin component, PIN family n=1 Tax=candidate division CSSED10-310 bacterium TaxID=2855610 RepID=A0ABV6Z1G8_UNCC1
MVPPEKPIRVVLDTNVLISAILFQGSLSQFVIWWQQKDIIPLLSRETFAEFKAALHYPKFQLSISEISYIIEEIILPYFDIVEIDAQEIPVCRDPHDDIFLFTAAQGNAAFLVTGDQDLLIQNIYQAIRILSPRDFCTIMETKGK